MLKQLLASSLVAGVMLGTTGSATSYTRYYRGNTLDPINKGPLNTLRRDGAHCSGGWIFPGLVWGDRPISACMINVKRKNVFGGDF